MRKVNVTVLYTEHTAENSATWYNLNNITLRLRDGMILTLYSDTWDKVDRDHPYKYTSLWEIHKEILGWVKYKGYKIDYKKSCGAKLYDILWINSKTHDVRTLFH